MEKSDNTELIGDKRGPGDAGVHNIVEEKGHEGGVIIRSKDPVAQWIDTLSLAVVDLVAGVGKVTQPPLADILEIHVEEVLLAGHRPL